MTDNQRELIILAQKVFELLTTVANQDIQIAELQLTLKDIKISGRKMPDVTI